MLKNLLKSKRDPTHETRQRAKFEAWSAGLTRLHRTMKDLEAQRSAAVEVVRAAGRRTFDGEPFALTPEIRDAARTIAELDAILPVVRQLHREERARNLSPGVRRTMRPVKLDTSSEGTDFGGVLGGVYEPVPGKEG